MNNHVRLWHIRYIYFTVLKYKNSKIIAEKINNRGKYIVSFLNNASRSCCILQPKDFVTNL